MPRTVLRIGTRSSALALAQAEMVRKAINAVLSKRTFELVPVVTSGDEAPEFRRAGIKGLFVSDIQQALVNGKIDLAVHSAKDLPAETPEGVALAAITPREDPRDALLTRQGAGLERLEPGTTFGTSSLRRSSQLLAMGRGFVPKPIRGNVDTRLRKLTEGEVGALVVALAGLRRLGKDQRVVQVFSPEVMMPAPGQGALAVECRASDKEMRAALGEIEEPAARRAYEAERALMVALGGDCSLPLGALATITGNSIRLRGMVATLDGKHVLRDEQTGEDPIAVAQALAERMRAAGAADIVAASREKI
ncbi:MAG: hydroxymethylbilane synthase [Actinomycetota bacterium]|nr:hydroxymethylbilane synthase [Actinomycetota bacterium]